MKNGSSDELERMPMHEDESNITDVSMNCENILIRGTRPHLAPPPSEENKHKEQIL